MDKRRRVSSIPGVTKPNVSVSFARPLIPARGVVSVTGSTVTMFSAEENSKSPLGAVLKTSQKTSGSPFWEVELKRRMSEEKKEGRSEKRRQTKRRSVLVVIAMEIIECCSAV